ncbi:thioredoxin family protein [Halomarina litorea]|uniref:thioredoxin family protein n=1 Tax=Halomarina litorea TaxID=2961595 RepID=UPI0020C2DDF5|nr:thioredoxin family protein [Halomarina sp. BCD28]
MTGDDATADAPDLTEADVDALVDSLVEGGVLTERADGTLATTAEFEQTRGIYYDTYGNATDTVFRESVASSFDLSTEDAEARIEREGVTREMFVDYLSVTSHLDDGHSRVDRARMAMLVGEVAPDTPVPEGMAELDDEGYGEFLAEHDRAAMFVWKRNCAPCDSLKRDLDEILADLPESVAVAGVDGESVDAFRREFEVEAAPSILLFADGEAREGLRGYVSPEQVAAAAERAYGPD